MKEALAIRKVEAPQHWKALRLQLVGIYRATEGLAKRACGIVLHEGSSMNVHVIAGDRDPGWLLPWITLAEYILEKEKLDD